MALKITQRELKRKHRGEIIPLKYAIYGRCYDCSGFQADGYQDCGITTCPLYPYRLKQSVGRISKSLASYLSEVRRQIEEN